MYGIEKRVGIVLRNNFWSIFRPGSTKIHRKYRSRPLFLGNGIKPSFRGNRRKKNAIALFLYFFLLFIYLEFFLKLFSGNGISDMFYPIWLSLPVALLVSLLSTLSPSKKANWVISISFSAATTLLFLIQHIYFYIFKTYMTIYSLSVGAGQAMGFTDTIFAAIGKNLLPIVMFSLPIILFVAFGKNFFVFYQRDFSASLTKAAFVIIISLLGILWLHLGDRSMYSPYDLYYKTNSLDMSVKKLGLLTGTRLNFTRQVFGSDNAGLNLVEIEDQGTNSNISGDSVSEHIAGSDNSSYEQTPAPIVFEPNVLDNLDLNALIETETDETIKELHQYFNSITPTDTNEYTGMFEGYNLVMFTAEAFSHMAVDPVYTPTLYKLVNSGFVFNDFYNPIWGVSTSDGEYVTLTGLIPKEGVWSFYRSGLNGNDMRFTMGKQFEALGYTTFGYHNHTFDYYGRDYSHPNMGYTYKALGNGLDVEEVWPESDLEMMEKSVDDWINEEHFHAYYMTVSGHMEYNFNGNMQSYRHMDEVENMNMSEQAKAYMACNIELDLALEYLIKRLESAGKLDNTLIVLSADHYPYGLDIETFNEFAGHEVEETFELYKNNCIIWSGSMTEPVIVDKPACSMDIIPTISNLLGLDFDSRMLMGTDVMSNEDPLIVFHDSSFIKGDLRYDANKGEYFSTAGKVYTDEYVNSLKNKVANNFRISAAILENDYYSCLK